MLTIGYVMPLDLTIRPVPRVVRELHPSLAAYRVIVLLTATLCRFIAHAVSTTCESYNGWVHGCDGGVCLVNARTEAYAQPKPMRYNSYIDLINSVTITEPAFTGNIILHISQSMSIG